MASSEGNMTGLPAANVKEPAGVAYCRCTACRKQSGSASGTPVYFSSEGLFVPAARGVELEAKLATFTHPTDGGNTMRCYFCPKVRRAHLPRPSCCLPDGSLRSTVAFKGGVIDEGVDWKAMKPANRLNWALQQVILEPAEWDKLIAVKAVGRPPSGPAPAPAPAPKE
ncbi:hypothetical protein B0T24DRAFT_653262 [Lasiosphaeria ovina]|uniref:CENP-V/GFA domain-containing protein n=1 Tax=Lasiosphaeria ovina TaxID=92902 RepID=A0AAE0JS04_9PEZI|nr:hypothetical protein B0T24DRAFT_653262 [Lasiosphaeria ovina]